eukprot:c32427_g1_i1.p1 GENE.c32427_g1_i1~~c32427_g1_i1.p1  ORF type:complete len:510 (+),score=111.49 c32427_g1_i1:38-1567(+)
MLDDDFGLALPTPSAPRKEVIESGVGEWAQVPLVVRNAFVSMLARQAADSEAGSPHVEIQRLKARLEVLEQSAQQNATPKNFVTPEQLKAITVKLLRSIHSNAAALEDMQLQLRHMYLEIQSNKASQSSAPKSGERNPDGWSGVQDPAGLSAVVARQNDAISVLKQEIAGLRQALVSTGDADLRSAAEQYVANSQTTLAQLGMEVKQLQDSKQDKSDFEDRIAQLGVESAESRELVATKVQQLLDTTSEFVRRQEFASELAKKANASDVSVGSVVAADLGGDEEGSARAWTKVDPFRDEEEEWDKASSALAQSGEGTTLKDLVATYQGRSRVAPDDPSSLLQCFFTRVQETPDKLRILSTTVYKSKDGQEDDTLKRVAEVFDENGRWGKDVSQTELATLLVQVEILPSKQDLAVLTEYINRSDGLMSRNQFIEICLLFKIFEKALEWWEESKAGPFWDLPKLEELLSRINLAPHRRDLKDLVESQHIQPAYEIMFVILWGVVVAEAKDQ